jgi:hypothetical protein
MNYLWIAQGNGFQVRQTMDDKQEYQVVDLATLHVCYRTSSRTDAMTWVNTR